MKHLIFDCDGVLVDSEIIAAQVMVEVLAENGIDLSMDYYLRNCTGRTFSGLKVSLSKEFDKLLPDDFIQSVSSNMEDRVENDLQAVDGMAVLLKSLTKINKSVVSNSSLPEIRHSLGKTNLAQHFDDSIFSSEQVERAKPAPDVYLLAAKSLGVNPAECLVIEDSLSGATAAIEAGMTVIGFLAGKHIVDAHGDRLRDIGVEHTAKDSADLQSLILRYFKD